ncbi:MAG: hypothetical protein WA474_18985 [Candidatus Sulfotelmatobacter sp.]
MSHPIEESYTRFVERATALEALADKMTAKPVSLALQKAYGSLKACAELLLVMEDESCSNMKKTLAKAAAVERPAHQIEAMATMIAVLDQFPRLLQSAVLLSEAKDAEAMKHIAGHVLKTAVDLAIIFSGAKTIKDVAELLKVIDEVAKTGGSVEMRKKQVKAATDVLDWIEEITLACLVWAYAAQRYISDITGHPNTSNEDVMQLVIERMARCASSWNPT